MWTPWARGYCPSPQERRNLPSRSNTIIGCSPRLNTWTLSLASTPTAPTSLNDQPSGSLAQSSTMRYRYSPLPTMIAMNLLPFGWSRAFGSVDPLVFLQGPQIGRVRLAREEPRPQRPAHLADIKVAV